jgi:hypothetical protein
MITAAITAAVAAVLALFGVKPGPYLVVVAAVVKGLLVLGGILLARKVMKARDKPAVASEPPAVPPEPR